MSAEKCYICEIVCYPACFLKGINEEYILCQHCHLSLKNFADSLKRRRKNNRSKEAGK